MSLQVENFSVVYQTLSGDVKALTDATFSLADGEIMGLAGESGCGKTTLGKGLILLTEPMRYVSGKVTLDEVELPVWDMKKMNQYRFKEISIVPQYSMSAMNPTRKIGKMISELLDSRGERYEMILPELKRRLDLVELPYEVLDAVDRYSLADIFNISTENLILEKAAAQRNSVEHQHV